MAAYKILQVWPLRFSPVQIRGHDNFELKIIQPAVTIVVDVTCLRFGLNKSYFHPTTAKKTPRPHNLSMELRFKWSIIVKFVLYINVWVGSVVKCLGL